MDLTTGISILLESVDLILGTMSPPPEPPEGDGEGVLFPTFITFTPPRLLPGGLTSAPGATLPPVPNLTLPG